MMVRYPDLYSGKQLVTKWETQSDLPTLPGTSAAGPALSQSNRVSLDSYPTKRICDQIEYPAMSEMKKWFLERFSTSGAASTDNDTTVGVQYIR